MVEHEQRARDHSFIRALWDLTRPKVDESDQP
jgi:hypothetical protein